ncbi:MAG TPA: hypothetical protein VJN71_05555 [Nitrososphaerales archaeon]|nr:hypothetical protein [Nitrososphaerales archaeon]
MVTYRASKLIIAPIKYVYDWATNFKEDDDLIFGGKARKIILLKTNTKSMYASYEVGSDGKPKISVSEVALRPKDYTWHLDYYSEIDIETGEYKLSKVGKDKTRIDMVFKNKRKHSGKGPSSKQFEKEARFLWDKYAAALEKDFNSGKKAN